jgi:hypothetical protein
VGLKLDVRRNWHSLIIGFFEFVSEYTQSSLDWERIVGQGVRGDLLLDTKAIGAEDRRKSVLVIAACKFALALRAGRGSSGVPTGRCLFFMVPFLHLSYEPTPEREALHLMKK